MGEKKIQIGKPVQDPAALECTANWIKPFFILHSTHPEGGLEVHEVGVPKELKHDCKYCPDQDTFSTPQTPDLS